MMDFATFASMGGYGVYVWGAYGLAVVGYGAAFIHTLVKFERLKKMTDKK